MRKNVALFQSVSIIVEVRLRKEDTVAKVSIFGVLSNIQILLKTALGGHKVGVDQYGNVYYTGKPRGGDTRERRWVIYKENAEASLVPPGWHGWLHHQTDSLPEPDGKQHQPWQKPHQPNLTATDKAYFPPGDPRAGGNREHATGDYVAWQPPQ
jgi:NADH:ubiquinone oxidoreductase subunit